MTGFKAGQPVKLKCGHLVKFSQHQIDTGKMELDTCAGCAGSVTEFETKDSGERIEYNSGMRRDIQTGKPRFDLLLPDDQPYDEHFITRIAKLLARGAEKYGERNWQLANSTEELSRFRASGLRHMFQYLAGETDEDHAAAVAFNLMAAEYVKWKLDNGIGKTITAADMNTGVRDNVVEEKNQRICSYQYCYCGDPDECYDRLLRIQQERHATSQRDV